MKILTFLFTWMAFTSCTTTTTENIAPNADREPAGLFFKSSKKFAMRFQLNSSDKWDQGVRLAEYRTTDVDVTYKVYKVEPPNVIFKVYISNVGKKNLKIDSSLFNVTSLISKKSVVAEKTLWADEKKPAPAMSLRPGESASSELKFAINEPVGRWALRNKLTNHSFNFLVSEN